MEFPSSANPFPCFITVEGSIEAGNELRSSMANMYKNHSIVEGQLITRLFHRLLCVLLLHTMLSADSIHIGALLPNAIFLAKKVVAFCRMQVIRPDGEIEDYYLQSWHSFSYIMLGCMALPKDCLHSNFRPVEEG